MRKTSKPPKADDPRLAVKVGSVTFPNPFIVASGPTVKWKEQLVLAEACGWAGASLKLAFDPEPYISLPPRYRYFKKEAYHAFTAEKRLTFKDCLRLLQESRNLTRRLILFANITYIGDKPGLTGWIEMAQQAEAAGAHVIELNMCCPNMSFNVAMTEASRTEQTGASMGQNATVVGMITEAVKQSVKIPVFVKITPEGGRIAEVAKACYDKGADCVCSVANRLAIADFDIENVKQGPYRLQDEPTLACFSGPWIKPLALRDVFEIRRKAGAGVAVLGTGGIAGARDAIQMIMCGADLIGVCTETMLKGFDFLPRWLKGLSDFMERHAYRSCRDFRDLAVGRITSADKLTLHSGYAEVDLDKCTGCTLCEAVGHCNAITIVDKKSRIDREKCSACSTCVEVCPVAAIHMVDTGILEKKS
ncbi:MAG: 4Fe-4S binding protein [Lentisphaerae bacterium]|nr:4Fe-4S binding protein [Lentisphaerota bacterium]